ncbi:MAG: tetratricopeptide repeat protein [Pseudomonadota bacterium]
MLQEGQALPAETAFLALLRQFPAHPEVLRMLGICALQRGASQRAVDWLQQAVDAAPDSAAARCNLGSAWRATGAHEAAREAFDAALEIAPELPEAHNNLGALAQIRGDLEAARSHFERALAQGGPASTAAVNLAGLELVAGNAAGARRRLRGVLAAAPGHPVALRLDALALGETGPPEAAIAALGALPPDPEVLHRRGALFEETGRWDEALAAQQQVLALDPSHGSALSDALFLAARLCRWADVEDLRARFMDAHRAGVPGLKPFTMLSQPGSATLQLDLARSFAAAFETDALRPIAAGTDLINIGFVSSGFRNHPTGCLVAELFETFGRDGFRWHAYAVGPDDGSPLRARIATGVDRFTDLQGQSHAAMAERIRSDGIDILVDLRGFGGGAVTEVFARRPAPIQVNWLAYPATMGATFIDYMIVDPVVASPPVAAALEEAPVFLPQPFQPCDGTRDWQSLRVDRSACGLPVDVPVLASFNNSYKFTRPVFDAWMAILDAVPDAVLWLLAPPAGTSVVERLRREASRRGIDRERLHFMPKQPHLAYLARYEHVDLFLDTWPYNAHTTAGDALFAGCPVLTLAGETFAGRVATSLLEHLGLDGLVAGSTEDYIRRAVELAGDPAQRRALRDRLAAARSTAGYFDANSLARSLEAAFREMVRRARGSEAPVGLRVTADGRVEPA